MTFLHNPHQRQKDTDAQDAHQWGKALKPDSREDASVLATCFKSQCSPKHEAENVGIRSVVHPGDIEGRQRCHQSNRQ